MPTATFRDLIYASLTELNVLAAGETASADDAAIGLASLNRLIDSWNTEGLQLYTFTRTTWTIVSGTAAYTVGVGGTVNVARPVIINKINFIDTSADPDMEYPTQPLTEDAYDRIPQKAQTSPFPRMSYYNPTFPLGTLTFFPVPTSSTLLGALYAPAGITEATGLTTSVSLPPGYQRMIVKNLALEMLPSFARQVDQMLYKQAQESKEVVKRANKRILDMSFEAASLIQGPNGIGRWDINQGP